MNNPNNNDSTNKWSDVRPVIIDFAGEEFVIEYNDKCINSTSPIVAFVHSYQTYSVALLNTAH